MSGRAQAGQEKFVLKVITNIDFGVYNPDTIYIQYKLNGTGPLVNLDASILVGQESRGEVYHYFDHNLPVPAAGIYRVRVQMKINNLLAFTEATDWIVEGF